MRLLGCFFIKKTPTAQKNVGVFLSIGKMGTPLSRGNLPNTYITKANTMSAMPSTPKTAGIP